MAIFRPTRKNSGVETLLKILYELTADISLVQGEILLSQFKMKKDDYSTKMSMFLKVEDQKFLGVRNIWLYDVADTVQVIFATEAEGQLYVKQLRDKDSTQDYAPLENREAYRLDDLDRAAEDIRNFLLLGVKPSEPMTPMSMIMANELLKTIEFDVVASLDPDDIGM